MAHPAETPNTPALIFTGSRDAFQMLRRLATRGTLRNYNDVIAGELIGAGYAQTRDADLIVTEKGMEASRSFTMPRIRP